MLQVKKTERPLPLESPNIRVLPHWILIVQNYTPERIESNQLKTSHNKRHGPEEIAAKHVPKGQRKFSSTYNASAFILAVDKSDFCNYFRA
jgi:hypothetical protein